MKLEKPFIDLRPSSSRWEFGGLPSHDNCICQEYQKSNIRENVVVGFSGQGSLDKDTKNSGNSSNKKEGPNYCDECLFVHC